MRGNTLIIVLPCFNEEEVLPITIARMSDLLERMIAGNKVSDDSRLLFVDDGSKDKTWEIIESAHNNKPFVCGQKLARNVGHQNALMAGMENAVNAGADMVVTIDADLQDDINVIPEMVTQYTEGFDIVYGVRRERKTDTWFKKTTAQTFYRIMKLMGVGLVYNHADFRLMSSFVVKELLLYRERNLFLRGIVPCISDNSAFVYYNRIERQAGESKYPLRKMIHLASDGVTSFTIKPIKALIGLGAVFIIISLCILVYVLYNYFRGHVVGGWSSLMLSMWFIGGCIMVGLGIVGEYIGKIYMEVKDRPRYNVEKTLLK